MRLQLSEAAMVDHTDRALWLTQQLALRNKSHEIPLPGPVTKCAMVVNTSGEMVDCWLAPQFRSLPSNAEHKMVGQNVTPLSPIVERVLETSLRGGGPANQHGKRESKPTTPKWGGDPGKDSLLCGCGAEYTPRWVGTSGLHGTA